MQTLSLNKKIRERLAAPRLACKRAFPENSSTILKIKLQSTLTPDGKGRLYRTAHGIAMATKKQNAGSTQLQHCNFEKTDGRVCGLRTFDTMSDGEAIWVSQCSHAKNSSPSQWSK